MEGFPDEARFPVTQDKARRFIASFVGLVQVSTVKKHLHHLKEACDIMQIEWLVDLSSLQPLLLGLKAVQPHPKLTRPPLLAKNARILVERALLDPSDPFHLAMLTTTLIGFGAVMRSGEFCFPRLEYTDEDFAKKARVSNLSKLSNGAMQLKMPWDKTHGWLGRTVTIADFGLGTHKLIEKHI
ncbi:hypothetical protein JCM8097_001976 [Rhodosporidiobolus ruineniae]